MAKNKESTAAKNNEPTATEQKESAKSSGDDKATLNLKGYERMLNRMQEERKELQQALSEDLEEARVYVQKHPGEGVLYAFVGGLALGLLLGMGGRSNKD